MDYEKNYKYIKKENELLYQYLLMELGVDRAFFLTQMVNARMLGTDEYLHLIEKTKPKN